MSSSWIIQVGPKSNDTHPYKRQADGDLRHERRRPCEDKGRVWSDTVKEAKEHRGPLEAGRGQEGLSSRTFRGHVAQMTPWFWTSSLQNCERIHFVCLFVSSHQACDNCYRSYRWLIQRVFSFPGESLSESEGRPLEKEWAASKLSDQFITMRK